MAMCPKFGTRGRGVTVGVMVGNSVAVGGRGVEVEVAEGTEGISVGGAEVAQATWKTSKIIPKPERVIKLPFIQAALGKLRRWARG